MNRIRIVKHNLRTAMLASATLLTGNAIAVQDSSDSSFTVKSFYAGDGGEYTHAQDSVESITLLNDKSSAFLRENGGNIVIVDGESKFSAKNIKAIMDAGNAIIMIDDTDAMRDIKEDIQQSPGASIGYYTPTSGPSASFFTGEDNLTEATKLAYDWAYEAIAESKELSDVAFTRSPHPAFASKHRRSYTSGSATPKLNVFTQFWKLADDGDAEKDFWVAQMNAELVPDGTYFGYRNRYIKQRMDISPIPGAVIDEYAPTTSTSAVNIDFSVAGSPFSSSYDLSHTTITNHSDVSEGHVEWEHMVGWEFNVAENTMAFQPALEFTTPDGTPQPWNKVDESTSGTFTTWFATIPFVTRSVHFDEQGEIWSGRRLTAEHHDPFMIKSEYYAARGQDMCLMYFRYFDMFAMSECNDTYLDQQFIIRELPRDIAESSRTPGDDHITASYFQIESLNSLNDGLCVELKRNENATMKPCDPANRDQQLTFHQEYPGEFFRIENNGVYGSDCLFHETSDVAPIWAFPAVCLYFEPQERFFIENL